MSDIVPIKKVVEGEVEDTLSDAKIKKLAHAMADSLWAAHRPPTVIDAEVVDDDHTDAFAYALYHVNCRCALPYGDDTLDAEVVKNKPLELGDGRG